MIDVFISGGWLMFPILLCSILALAIIVERLWTLRSSKIAPDYVLPNLLHQLQNQQVTRKTLKEASEISQLGAILVLGVAHLKDGSDSMMLHMAEHGRHVTHELERFLDTLGTIAEAAPLLGLLGTVTGMIQVFSALTLSGPTNSEVLAGGISQALLTTAFGLSVAIPSMMFHRYFNRKIDGISVHFEQEASKLMDFVKEAKQKTAARTSVDDVAA